MTHYAIIGDGAAGTTAAFYIRRADPSARIEMYSDDPNAAYYRAALTNYLIGELREAQLFATPPDFYQTNHIQRIYGRVVSLDAKNSRFTLDNGSQVAYDQLLIAAGASPNPPSFTGSDMPGVMTMRTLQDARMVMDLISAKRLRSAVVIGGGPLGIEWVQGLLHHGVKVTYLLRGEMFFDKALDKTASDLVISRLRDAKVDVRLNEEIGEAIAGRDGWLRAVKLKNSGDMVECQLVGAAIGIRPNVDFLQNSAVDVAVDEKRGTPQGIKVDEAMRTNVPNVYAAGDIIYGTLGLWEPARLQGRVAGLNMTGGSEVFRRRVHYNATRLYDLDFAGAGEPNEKPGDEVLVDYPRGSGTVRYRKLIIREGKLIGVVLLGHRKEHVRKYGMMYRDLIEKKTDISSISKILLDASFDLASWMDAQELGDQIASARKITEAPITLSNAAMRRTRHELSGVSSKVFGAEAATTGAMLLLGEKRIPVKTVTRIGRKPENDLVLTDFEVSGQHAQIRWTGSEFVLEDLKSKNGTFLNGQRVSTPTRLASGALIKIGATQIQFVVGTPVPVENLRMTSAGLPEAPPPPSALPSDPVWGILQIGERKIPLQTTALILGRDPNVQVFLDDPTVSFKHAQIVRQAAHSYLLDIGSRNGTYVNGKRISLPHPLAHGDKIQLGNTTLVFHSASSPDSKLESAAAASIKPPLGEEARVKDEEPVPARPRPAPVPEKPIAPLTITLIVRGGDLAGKTFPLNQSPMTVGRNPKSHIVIPHDMTSWNHAILKQEDMKWFVKDLGSRNGTFLNDQVLEKDQPYPLKVGDKLKFGDTVLEVIQDA